MDLFNRLYLNYKKNQTRECLKNLSEAQLQDIGKSEKQVQQELLKSSLKHSVKQSFKKSITAGFVIKVNALLGRG